MEKGGRASLCWVLQLLAAISKPLPPCAQDGCPYHSLQASDSVTCFASWNVRGSEVDHFCMQTLKSVWDSAWPSSFAWKDVSMSQCHQTKETWNVEPIYEGQLPRKLIEPVKDFTWVRTKPLFLKPLTFFFFFKSCLLPQHIQSLLTGTCLPITVSWIFSVWERQKQSEAHISLWSH